MSSEEKIEATSQPEKEQMESEEQPTAPTAETDAAKEEAKSDTTEKKSEPSAEQQEATEETEEEEEEPDDGVPIVLVTGASGFIATHLIKQLLEQGRYRIRGTVRSKTRKEKVEPLLDLVAHPKYPLRLVEADLSKPETWKKAVKRCTYVFHVASPFPIGKPNEAAIVSTAVEGTVNVLQACADAGTIKRVVVTSSIAAVSCGTAGNPGNPPDYVYTEKDWSVESACEPYAKSKLKAEQAAWEFVKKLDEEKMFELTVVNPAYVQGPLLSASSGEGSKEFCQRLLNGKFPALPDVSSAIVDVRDVATAHIAAMEKSEAAGNRYILSNRTLHFREMAQIIGTEFQPQGYKIPTMNMPKAILWVGKFFDSAIKQIYPILGKAAQLSNERMVNELGVTPRPVEESIIDTCYSLIELGLARKRAGYLGHPSRRPPPPHEPTETIKDEGQAANEDSQAKEKVEEPQTESDEKPTQEGENPADEKPTEEGEKPADDEPTEEGEKSVDDKPTEEGEKETVADKGEKQTEDKPAEGEGVTGEGEKPSAVEERGKPGDDGEKPTEKTEVADEAKEAAPEADTGNEEQS